MTTVLPDWPAALDDGGLLVLATGGAARDEPGGPGPGRKPIPSLYADPLAWLVLEAVDDVLAHCPVPGPVAGPDAVAVALLSTHGTLDTMAAVARSVPTGRVSPMRFAGASVGGALGLTCIVHRFRGPTLMLTTTPADGLPAVLTAARAWLRTGAAAHVVVGVHEIGPDGHRVRTAVLTTPDTGAGG